MLLEKKTVLDSRKQYLEQQVTYMTIIDNYVKQLKRYTFITSSINC